MEVARCLKCNYEWIPRVPCPKKCPKCKDYNWAGRTVDLKICKICKRNFIKLHIHHINGNHEDNRESNKIKICVDCHSAIHTGIGKKRRQRFFEDEEIIEKLLKYRNKVRIYG